MARTAFVTGGSRGLGKAVAQRLAGRGYQVVIAARDSALGAAAAAEIEASASGRPVEVLVGDLSRMDDVRRLAAEARSRYPDVKLLVNNAGLSRFEREVTVDGLETMFAVNHLAPFVLSSLLLDLLERNQPAAIVNIASEQHRFVRGIPWDDLQAERRFRPLDQYSLTKLYNILFTKELARRTAGSGVRVNSVSPGFLRTGLGRDARGTFRLFLAVARPFQATADIGAEAVMPAIEASASGAYFKGGRAVQPSALALDGAAAAKLWDVSAALALQTSSAR